MFIIANIGVNWWSAGDPDERAIDLLKVAKSSGVHGVCVPYLNAEKLYRNPDIVSQTKKFDMTPELLYALSKWAAEDGMTFWAAPSYHGDIDYLDHAGVDGYHIQNGDIGYMPLIRAVAETDKPIMLSTGFATFEEVSAAVDEISKIRQVEDVSELELTLLHSTGGMPTPSFDSQLGRILDLAQEFFPLYVGFESFLDANNLVIDFISMAYNPAIVMRRLDLDDRKGVETEYSLTADKMRQLVDASVAMHRVNNPVDYAEGFVESDFDARIKRRRCKESEYLVPPER